MLGTAKKKKTYPGCLAHAVIGMFYSVVANQGQPQYTYQVQCFTASAKGEGGGGVNWVQPVSLIVVEDEQEHRGWQRLCGVHKRIGGIEDKAASVVLPDAP